jgi:GGDEF domain-containing protein
MSQEKENLSLEQKQAETLSRLFYMAYNSAVLYGGTHQTTQESALTFYNFIASLLKDISQVSIILDRETLYVENYCVDKIINARRLSIHFKKLKLQSITFLYGITSESIKTLFRILGDVSSYPNVEEINKELKFTNAQGIKLNYVMFKKITADEDVIDKESAKSFYTKQDVSSKEEHNKLIESLLQIISTQKLFISSNEKKSDLQLQKNIGINVLLDQLKNINSQIKDSLTDSSIPIDEIADAVINLKQEVTKNLEIIKKTHALDDAENVVINELDTLSREVILKLIREEYQSGSLSIKRLAQIIRRMLPNLKELKRMLPGLKEALLKEGMTLSDYLQLVNELLKEVEGEAINNIFESAVKEIGITVDELIGNIKENPEEAARLIVLASEIRKNFSNQQNQLSDVLTEYIEKISSSLITDAKEPSFITNPNIIKQALAKTQNELISKLKNFGIKDPILEHTSSLLSMRLEQTAEIVIKQWLLKFIENLNTSNEKEIIEALEGLMSNKSISTNIEAPLKEILAIKGFSNEQIEKIFSKIESSRKTSNFELPKGVLNVNATLYFLEREIKRHIRYNSPFSALIITLERIKLNTGSVLIPKQDDNKIILPQVLQHLRQILRDLDIVGSLGLVTGDIPFVILPMTDDIGANAVTERLTKSLHNAYFNLRDEKIMGVFAISFIPFNKKNMSGYRSFLELAFTNHKKKVEQINQIYKSL